MKKALITSLSAAGVFAVACDFSPSGPTTHARVRFANAISELGSDVGFTIDNDFISGSVVAFPGTSATCSLIEGGTVTVAFGAANASRTGLSNAVLSREDFLGAGESRLLVAYGTLTEPRMALVPYVADPTIGGNESVIGFVNLVPTGQTGGSLVASLGSGTALAQGGTLNFGGGPTGPFAAFTRITSGSHTFTIRDASGNVVLSNQSITLDGRSRNIIAIVPTEAGGYQWINIKPC